MFEPKQKHSTHSTTLDCTLLQPGRAVIFNGLDLNQFSVANGAAGDQLQLPLSSAVVLGGPILKIVHDIIVQQS